MAIPRRLLLTAALVSHLALAADPTTFGDWGIGTSDDKRLSAPHPATKRFSWSKPV
jgi:hypothetical protein